jgi:hypothetical protein
VAAQPSSICVVDQRFIFLPLLIAWIDDMSLCLRRKMTHPVLYTETRLIVSTLFVALMTVTVPIATIIFFFIYNWVEYVFLSKISKI